MNISAPKAWSITLFAPLAIMATYLLVSETHRYDDVALVMAIVCGLFGVMNLATSLSYRLMAAIAYVVLAGGFLVAFTLVFVCMTRGDCL